GFIYQRIFPSVNPPVPLEDKHSTPSSLSFRPLNPYLVSLCPQPPTPPILKTTDLYKPLTPPLFPHHRRFPKIACENLPTAVTTVLFSARRRWCRRAASVFSVLYPGYLHPPFDNSFGNGLSRYFPRPPPPPQTNPPLENDSGMLQGSFSIA
ncbi:hypothetical protein PIB30_089073, partial [Stylosanthes scabra]|nr:hypothetical protein [Stylosanthes scabra]